MKFVIIDRKNLPWQLENKFSTFVLHKLGVPSVDLGLQAISEALIAAFRTEDLQRAAS